MRFPAKTWFPSLDRSCALLLCGVSLLLLPACSSASKAGKPEYSRQLEPGERALHKVDSREVRGKLLEAYRANEEGLAVALEQSRKWYAAPSSKSRFPFKTANEQISHERALESVVVLKEILENSSSADGFTLAVLSRFDVYQTTGWDQQGTVLFTGYYAPIFKGSLTPTPEYQYPLYKRPSWLLTTKEGIPFGRRLANGRIVDSPDRAEIESRPW